MESEPGNGTKFIIRIPVFEKVMDTAKSDTIDHEKLEGSLSILLVDDEELLRKFISTVLVSEGYYVRECESGEGAIELLNQESFDVIISDMKMSGMGGKTLYAYIQKNHPDLVERVLFITGDVLGRETQSFLEITGCKYLEKPFTTSKLLACLTDLLKQ